MLAFSLVESSCHEGKYFIAFDKEIKPIEEIKVEWNDCCWLSPEEVKDIENLWKEI